MPVRFGALLLMMLAMVVPRVTAATIYQIDISGSVNFVGCPSAISCPSYPLMWGVSGGEAVTARLVYDDDAPLAFLDDASPEYNSARFDHTLPLSAPLGVEVDFGPYSTTAGSSGFPATQYAIHVFDDLNSTCCPDLAEYVSIEMTVEPLSSMIAAPAGFHDLLVNRVQLDFLNYGGSDLLSGVALPAAFYSLAWDEIRLTVDVFDPIDARAGTAFLTVSSLQVTAVQPIPALSRWGAIALIGSLAVGGLALRFGAMKLDPIGGRWT